jgi:hypothetical protein
VHYSLFLEKSVSFGKIDTKIDEGDFKEGGYFIVPEAELPNSPVDFSLYQDLYNALVGGKFSIDYGALKSDIEMKIFIRNLQTDTGRYTNLGTEADTLFSYFEIRIWELPDSNFYPEETSYYLNDGYYARFCIPKSEAFINFTQQIGFDTNEPLSFAFLETMTDNTDDWNGYGIENMDTPDSIVFKAIHLSRIGGGKRRIANNIIHPDSVLDVKLINSQEIPDKLTLIQNYPNPFNPSTIISYSLVESGNVKLNVYDLLGNHISTLTNDYQNPGSYEIKFNINDINTPVSSGIYFVQLRQNNSVVTKKILLAK